MSKKSIMSANHSVLKAGIGIFVMLFLHSTLIYPGGSTANFDSVGFSWKHNYVCNLMNQLAMNGEPNPSRPFAILAVIVLSATIAYFFFNFSKLMKFHKIWTPVIKYLGVAAMVLTTLMFTRYHDVVTLLSSICAGAAVIGIIRTLMTEGWIAFLVTGLLIVFLLVANNYIYYSGSGISYLPSLQKWTFGVVLLWILVLHQFLIQERV